MDKVLLRKWLLLRQAGKAAWVIYRQRSINGWPMTPILPVNLNKRSIFKRIQVWRKDYSGRLPGIGKGWNDSLFVTIQVLSGTRHTVTRYRRSPSMIALL